MQDLQNSIYWMAEGLSNHEQVLQLTLKTMLAFSSRSGLFTALMACLTLYSWLCIRALTQIMTFSRQSMTKLENKKGNGKLLHRKSSTQKCVHFHLQVFCKLGCKRRMVNARKKKVLL